METTHSEKRNNFTEYVFPNSNLLDNHLEMSGENPLIVPLKKIINDDAFTNTDYELPVAVGVDTAKKAKVIDLATAPHILVGGSIGQGKTIFLHSVIISLLYKKRPDELKFILIDPHQFDFMPYARLKKHFLAVTTDAANENNAMAATPRQAKSALQSLCNEMDERYKLTSSASADNIKTYNEKYAKGLLNPDESHRFLPYIVAIIDDYNPLISTHYHSPYIMQLVQKGEAVGIHLIVATKRAELLLPTIKANFPVKIAFRTCTAIDSRAILGKDGAERLNGIGDMWYLSETGMERIQGAYVDVAEISNVASFISTQPQTSIFKLAPANEMPDNSSQNDRRDELFDKATKLVSKKKCCSPSMLQRHLDAGYYRACRILEQLEDAGIVGAAAYDETRPVLIKASYRRNHKTKNDEKA